MFCCMKMKFEATEYWTDRTNPKFSSIVHMCIESSQAIINILENMQLQGLLGELPL